MTLVKLTLPYDRLTLLKNQRTRFQAYADPCVDRADEIFAQMDDMLSIFGSVTLLDTGRRRWSLVLLSAVIRLATHVEMPLKHHGRAASDRLLTAGAADHPDDRPTFPAGQAVGTFAAACFSDGIPHEILPRISDRPREANGRLRVHLPKSEEGKSGARLLAPLSTVARGAGTPKISGTGGFTPPAKPAGVRVSFCRGRFQTPDTTGCLRYDHGTRAVRSRRLCILSPRSASRRRLGRPLGAVNWKGATMRHAAFLLTSTAALALAGCSGGGGTATTRTFSIPAGDVATALQSGRTLTARTEGTSALSLNYGNGDTAVVPTRVSVQRTGADELTITIDGVAHVVTSADLVTDGNGFSYYEVEDDVNGIYYYFDNFAGGVDDFFTPGSGYAEALVFQTNQTGTGADTRGYAIIGTETRDRDLAGLPTASYSGRGRIDAAPATGWVDSGTSRTTLNADVQMTADFGAGTISGQMDNFRLRLPGVGTGTDVAGTMSMNAANFTSNGFSGTLTADGALAGSTGITSLDATYSGAFYGPAAEEVAGGISGTGTMNGAAMNASGYFWAEK